MAAVKTIARGVLVWLAVGVAAKAETIDSGSVFFYAAYMAGNGKAVQVPASPPAPAPPAPPAPAPAPAPPTPAPAPSAAAAQPVAAPAPSTVPAAAFVNLGVGPYTDSAALTDGGAQPWFNSPVVAQLFGHVPNASDRDQFTSAVLRDVEQTYRLSGLPDVHVTADPKAPAAHMLSVVSNTSNPTNPNAIGITNVGDSGFSFIDKFGAAQSVDQLEWAVAHNVAHELMHAFGGSHHDTTGKYLDSAVSNWSQLFDPNFKLGPEAVQELVSKNLFFTNAATGTGEYGAQVIGHPNFCNCPLCRQLRGVGVGAQLAGPSPVPEPAAIAGWAVTATVVVLLRARRRAA